MSETDRAANTAYCRTKRARRAARGLPPDDPRHGKPSTYTNWHCRCDRCTAANSAASQARRDRANAAARVAEGNDR